MSEEDFICCLFCYNKNGYRTRLITPLGCWEKNGLVTKTILPCFYCETDQDKYTLRITINHLLTPIIYYRDKNNEGKCYSPVLCCIKNDCYSPIFCYKLTENRCSCSGSPVHLHHTYYPGNDEASRTTILTPFWCLSGNETCYPYKCSCTYTSSNTVKLSTDVETHIAKTEGIKQQYLIKYLCCAFNCKKVPIDKKFIASLPAKVRELERVNTTTVIHSKLRNHDEHNIGALIRQYME
jgi:hypothetical protein